MCLANRRNQKWQELPPGTRCEDTVKGITEFGAQRGVAGSQGLQVTIKDNVSKNCLYV